MKRTKFTKTTLLGKGRRPNPEHRFADLKRPGQTFTVDCTGMTPAEQKRKRESLSSLCWYYGQKWGRRYGAEITGEAVTVQLLSLT